MDISISIRQALRTDLSEILRLYAQPKMSNGKILSIHEAETIFSRLQLYPNYHIYVAENNRDASYIVGSFSLLIMDNLGHAGALSGIVENVIVDSRYEGRGIGKLMMQYAKERCQEAGCYKIALSSNLSRTEAHAFYDSLGFEKHGYSFRICL